MNYKNNVRTLYAIRFFHNLIPAYVIERLFWAERGMTIQMVVYAEIIYAVTVVLLEIPSGIIADRWSRKNMLLVNAFFGCCEFFILVYASSFWHFALAIFLAGVGRSACSGAENALLYDSLLADNNAEAFEKSLGRLNAFDFSAAVIAALSGGLLAGSFDLRLNYWLSFLGMLISLCITLLLKEPKIHSKEEKPMAVKEYVKASFTFFKSNIVVCLILLTGVVTGGALNFLDEFWQLYIGEVGVPIVYYGVISSIFLFLRMPGNILAHRLKERWGYKTLLKAVILIFTAGFFYMFFVKNLSSLVAIFLICLAAGVIDPIIMGYLHHRIDSSMRATIESFQSLGLRAAIIVLGMGFGYISTHYSIFKGYGYLSIVCGSLLIFFLTASKKYD